MSCKEEIFILQMFDTYIQIFQRDHEHHQAQGGDQGRPGVTGGLQHLQDRRVSVTSALTSDQGSL